MYYKMETDQFHILFVLNLNNISAGQHYLLSGLLRTQLDAKLIHYTRLETMAGHQTMSGVIGDLTRQTFVSSVMLTGHIQLYLNELKFSCCSVVYYQ